MKRINKILGVLLCSFFLLACRPLEKENLDALGNMDVLSNPAVAEGYVNTMYVKFMPASFIAGRKTDETMSSGQVENLEAYLRGTMTIDTYNKFPYQNIRDVNHFLSIIDQATFAQRVKASLKGQALFWRAWAYFNMVKAYGGVELVLTPTSPTDEEAIFGARNTTSECIAQIIRDLDNATELLEPVSNIGRIDKCVSLSFKGRVLLYWASPQFNRDNDRTRWDDAYKANKDALTFLEANGKGLYENYGELWHDEQNKEVIMYKSFQFPDFTNGDQSCIRPLLYSRGCTGANQPSLELVNAYPLKDGSRFNPSTMDMRKYHENRDDRFYASIAYNGSAPYIAGMFGESNMWTYYYDGDNNPATGINGKERKSDADEGIYYSYGGFYMAKMVDRKITKLTVDDGGMDWIEIRFAEVLMNLAEAANETEHTSEALSILYQIRRRAGILPGSGGNYGISASSIPDVRKAIIDERFVEFAFEDKRFWDLRRWRLYTATMNALKGKSVHGLRIEWNGTATDRPVGLTDINEVRDRFTVTEIADYRAVTMLDEDKYSFFGIPLSVLNRNEKIEQNNTWGGTFDPLQ